MRMVAILKNDDHPEYAQTSGEVYSTIRYLKKIRAGLDAVILGLEESLDDFSSGR